jgi:hypothetical protein
LQYGDRPPDGVHAEVVELLGTHASSGAHSAPAPAPPVQSAVRTAANTPVKGDDVKSAVDADVAQTKDKQCTDAQDRYKKLIEGRRIYKTGADGEREYMTSQEIDTERVNAKRDIDTACNSAS